MPPGIGRQIAADLAAALGAEAEREEPVNPGGSLVQLGEDTAGLDGHREIDRVDGADAVHAAKGDDDVLSVLRRYPAADEARVAALWHDRQLCLSADTNHRSDLLGRCRPDDEPGGTTPKPPRLDQIGFLLGRIGDPAARSDRRFDLFGGRWNLH